MKISFNADARHKVTEANINYYATPFVHPERVMNEHDFIYVLEGEWKIGQNSETFELKKDSLLILSARERHYGISPCRKDTRTMYFHLSFEKGDGADDGGIDCLIDGAANSNIKKLFREIVEAKLSGNERRASVIFDLLMCELAELGTEAHNTRVGDRIKNIIHQNPEKFLSNEELAGRLGVSVKTAETKFKALFGITIHQYILKFKTEQAIALFRNFPDMQIKEIAYNLGFYDEYHFSKQFKRVTGYSPTVYKNIKLRYDEVP